MRGTAGKNHERALLKWTHSLPGFYGPRRPVLTLAIALALGLVTALVGHQSSPIPTADVRVAPPAAWRILLLGPAVLPVLALYSPLASLESVSTEQFHRVRARFLVVMASLCSGIFLAASAVVLPPSLVEHVARSIPGWTGIALISGCTLGWRLAWVLPVCLMCPMLYWGIPDPHGQYPWWEFTARPTGDVCALVLNGALLGMGVFLSCLTPWRLQTLRDKFRL